MADATIIGDVIDTERARAAIGVNSLRCLLCGAKIFWARALVSGKSIPIDTQTSLTGNVDVYEKESSMTCRVGGGMYESHFDTCPHAHTWRRGGGK